MLIPSTSTIAKQRKEFRVLKNDSRGAVNIIDPKHKHKVNLYGKQDEATEARDTLVDYGNGKTRENATCRFVQKR